jgi:hypothetical protein
MSLRERTSPQARRLKALRRFRLKRRHLRGALTAAPPTAAVFGYAGMQSAGALEPVAVMAPLKGVRRQWPLPIALCRSEA